MALEQYHRQTIDDGKKRIATLEAQIIGLKRAVNDENNYYVNR